MIPQTLTADPRFPEVTDTDIAILVNACGGQKEKALKVVMDVVAERERNVKKAVENPLLFGYVPEQWKFCAASLDLPPFSASDGDTIGIEKDFSDYCDELVVLGGNRSSKSEFIAWIACMLAVKRPNQRIAMFHSSENSSITLQQPRVYKYLPPEMRNIKKTRTECVSFSMKCGFTDKSFILPNGSQVFFFNYGQNTDMLQGSEFDLVIFDELVPMRFINEFRYRVMNRKGKIIVSFTPITGYTNTVAEYLAGAVVVKTEVAPLLRQDKIHVKDCPAGHMPRLLQCRKKNHSVRLFWTRDNPFNPYSEMVKKSIGQPERDIMIRAYGWTDKMDGSVFPRYGKAHKISREKFRSIERGPGQRYCCADPGGRKNWFIKWYFVTPESNVICYREWPDQKNYGDWAVYGEKSVFVPGPAQRSGCGANVSEIKKMILELEGWRLEGTEWIDDNAEKIEQRFIDPRMGGTPAPGLEEGTTIIRIFNQEHQGRDGVVYPEMEWTPGPTSLIDESILMINDWMSYNDNEPVSLQNCPRFYVVDDMLQSDLCYREWNGDQTCALKDIVDPDRYFLKTAPEFIRPESYMARGGGSYYDYKRVR
ncbi:MAG: terminase family protein [Deltaproteobacteria bacterium]|nr:terminase family protein [Deltaproteobacteria bacterium]